MHSCGYRYLLLTGFNLTVLSEKGMASRKKGVQFEPDMTEHLLNFKFELMENLYEVNNV